jgi:hypothetical protein
VLRPVKKHKIPIGARVLFHPATNPDAPIWDGERTVFGRVGSQFVKGHGEGHRDLRSYSDRWTFEE